MLSSRRLIRECYHRYGWPNLGLGNDKRACIGGIVPCLVQLCDGEPMFGFFCRSSTYRYCELAR